MDRRDVRAAWERCSATYAERRTPDGPDADLLDDLLATLGDAPVVLDVGCGDGARTLANLPAGTIGLDIARNGLALAANNAPHARLIQGDLATLPIGTDAVDGLTAYHAVFHVPRDRHRTVYEEFARVLRPGGRLLVTIPGGRFHTVRHNWMGDRMLFSSPGREQTLDLLETAGFEAIETVVTDDPLGSNTEFAFATAGT